MRIVPNIISAAWGILLLTGGISLVNAADPIEKTKPDCSRSITSTMPNFDMANEGRRAFMRMNCYSCHGMSGHGAGMGPSLIGKANSVDVVYEGDGHGMPGFKNNLCSNDVNNLRAYLALLGTGNEPSFTHWWEKTPSR